MAAPHARSFSAPLGWLVAAGAVVLVAAALAVALGRLPVPVSRAEAIAAADREAMVAMDSATLGLHRVLDDVTALSADALGALTAVLAGDRAGLEPKLTAGAARLATIADDRAAFAASVAAVPGMGAGRETRLSAAVLARYDALVADESLGRGLEVEWTQLVDRARQAATLAALLRRHDTETATAASLGAEGHYADAIAALDTPQATLTETGKLRDLLATTSDVSTLTAWLTANATYDDALRALYAALVASGGTVDDAVRAAAATEAAARSGLPTDSRALAVVLSDVTRGGLNQNVITITKARTAIESAIAALAAPGASPAAPGSSSAASPAVPGSSSAPAG